jgi:2-keto-4-pentenoate hydratase/2-oxohepta-3-ene-1,7-dioic acid hydratase in catechol pathway
MIALIRTWFAGADALEPEAAADRDALPLDAVQLLAPIHRPGKILGSGINYAGHKQENPGAVMPTAPGYFAKLPSAVIGPGEPIVLPYPAAQVDYEVELAVVIGRPARGVPRERALEHVFGYTVVNDVSARDVQFREPGAQWITYGKGFDTFCPMGPELVLADEVPDPSRLRLRSYVNGELRQDAPTAEMLFPVPVLIEHWSRHITLDPGDVLATGTPAGCGTFRHPPLWLKPGDAVSVEVDQIGRLTNPVVRGW